MAITINTNLSSLITQRNLDKATKLLNSAIERMTTGSKINRAADNAAGFSIARKWEVQLSSLDVAADNAASGADMLTTLEDNYALVSSHVQRIRDLTEQAANGTYGDESKTAIQAEITSRLEEIDRIAASCEFNGKNLMDSTTSGVSIQVGLGKDEHSRISLDDTLFADSKVISLFNLTEGSTDAEKIENFAKKCAGKVATAGSTAKDMLTTIDSALTTISGKVTKIGAAQNRIESAMESIAVQYENVTSSLSTIKDADVAKESAKYIKAQILQQAAATLLSTANQSPSIALQLI